MAPRTKAPPKEPDFADVIEDRVYEILEEIKPDRLAEFQKIASDAAGHAVGKHIGHTQKELAVFIGGVRQEIDAATQRNNVTVGEFIAEAVAGAKAELRMDIGYIRDHARRTDTYLSRHTDNDHGQIAPKVGDAALVGTASFVLAFAGLGIYFLIAVLAGAY